MKKPNLTRNDLQKSFIKNKAAVAGFCYFCGIGTACFAFEFARTPYFGASKTIMIAIIAAAIIATVMLGASRKTRVAALILLSFAVGAIQFTVYDVNVRQPVFAQASVKTGETFDIQGVVVEKTELAFYQANYLIKTRSFANSTGSTQVLITAPDVHSVGAGDVVFAQATLCEFRNTGFFPERNYNLSRGVLLKGDADFIELIEHGGKSPVNHIADYNEFIKSKIGAAFPNDYGALLQAVFLGDKSRLSTELSQNVKVAGVAHYTAVSGLHLTMITHMFMLAFALTPYRNNRRVKFAALVLIVVTLAIFFNLTVSVTRAAIMLIICYGGELFMRKGNTLNSLGFALLIILAFEPYAVFDAGLIMSFSGTFGVGVLAPMLTPPQIATRAGEKGRRGRLVYASLNALIVSACASVCVLPASALYFGGISVWSPLTSVIVVPIFTVAAGAMVLYSLLAAFTATPIVALGQVCLLVAGVMSRIMCEIIELFARFSAAWVSLDYWFVPIWIILAIIAVAAVRLIYKSDIKAVKAACITVATLALMICAYNLNSVNSGKTYIKIYSDGVSALTIAEQSGTKIAVVTHDTPKAHEQLSAKTKGVTFVALLNSARNNSAAFAALADKASALEYAQPGAYGAYDISGKFTLDIAEGETTLTLQNGYRILYTRAANDNAAARRVNVVVGYNRVVNKRDFNSDYVVYVSRSVPIEFSHERSAYYEPVYLLIE